MLQHTRNGYVCSKCGVALEEEGRVEVSVRCRARLGRSGGEVVCDWLLPWVEADVYCERCGEWMAVAVGEYPLLPSMLTPEQ